jgi:putative membrane protein
VTPEAQQPGPGGPGWLRLSPRSLLVRPVTDLLRLFPFLLGLLYLHSRGTGGSYWGLAFAALAVTASIVRWLTTRYRITDERVYVRRGLLNQKVLSVARDRIRTVDLTAHVLYRMLGLRRVAIGTGRSDRHEGESFRLDALTLADAEALRALLLAGRSAAAAAAAAAATAPAGLTAAPRAGPAPGGLRAPLPAAGPGLGGFPADRLAVDSTADADRAAATEIVRLRLSWIRFAPLTMTGLVIIGVFLGFILQFSDEARVNLAASTPVRRLLSSASALPLPPRIAAVALGVAFCLIVVSTAGYIAVFWGFRLVRLPEGTLAVTRGLLTTRATTIDAGRLRGAEISEPLPLRAARGARCIAITTGLRVGHGAERGGSVLLPPAPRRVAIAVAADVVGGPPGACDGPLVRHGPRARRRRYLRAVGGAALLAAVAVIAGLAAGAPAWTWLSPLVLLPLAAALAEDRYRSLGHALLPGALVTRTGSLVRRRAVLATDGIIGWRIHQSWFQRRQGLVTLTAATAAGRQHYEARDVPQAQALAVAAAATPDLVRPFLAG